MGDRVEYTVADAKDRLREAGIVVGPDRYGNWFVPCGDPAITDWQPGDPVDGRVMVRNNGALENSGLHWDWLAGRWAEGEIEMPDGPLTFIY